MARNLWGWGEVEAADRLEDSRARAEAFFGPLEVEEAAAPRVPAPRVEVPPPLRDFSSAEPRVRAAHALGKSYVDRVRGLRGDFSSAPDLVAFPRDEADLAAVFEAAQAQRLSVIPFGGGSSVVGGVEPRLGPAHRGAVTVDLSRLSRVLEVDEVSRVARIQAGVFGPELERQLAPHGLTLRHFPQSFEYSTLGGWLATRAGGHFATVYTHIDELTESLRLVTPRGVVQTPRVPAHGAGPDANRLALGSEGTLGFITEAWMRVRPRPVFRGAASVHFADFSRAVDATRAIAQSGLFPANCRLLDEKEALLNGVAGDGSSVLVLGFESADASVAPLLDCAVALAEAHGGTCPRGKTLRDDASKARSGDAGDSWRASFLRGPYLQDAMIRLGVVADTFETACTWKAFPTLYAEVMQAVRDALERGCGGGLVTCRFTHVYPDGPAPYFTFLGRGKRGGEAEQWAELKRAASDALAKHGGTITHHHAVGRVHRPWYDRERPALFGEALTAVKRAWDPSGLLNPGVLIDAR
ncbi:MAG: FAD-binding oxidoreductase [Myxococcales bacterium]|nr:FAD-binding oxidoreductase [Myxococcales bacterium]